MYEPFYVNKRPTSYELDPFYDIYGKVGLQKFFGSIGCIKLGLKQFQYLLRGQFNSIKDFHLAAIKVEAWEDEYLYV